MSLSVQDWFRPPLRPAPALNMLVFPPTPNPADASPFKNQEMVISSAARRDSPNWRCRLVEAWSTSLNAVWMLSELDWPVALSKELPRLNWSRSSRNLVTALVVDSVAMLA